MDSDEVRISKIADDLHNQIETQLTSLFSLNLNNTSHSRQTNNDQFNSSLDSIIQAIDQFQPSPQLLDYRLRHFIERLIDIYSLRCLNANNNTNDSNNQLENAVSTIFYSFSKVRGIKAVSNCLTSNIYLITYILDKLDENTWQGRFFLLVWLSILILAPFPLIKVDSKLPETIYRISNQYLESAGKENEAAAILMARFLSRNDSTQYLDLFITENFNSISWEQKSQYNKTGTLSVLNFLLKISKKSSIINYTSRILTLILNEIQEDTDNTSILRMHIKVLGKISLVCESYNNYDSIEEILNILFDYVGHYNTSIRYSSAKQIAKLSKDLPSEMRYEIVVFLLNELEIKNLNLSCSSKLQPNLLINSEIVNIEEYHGILLTLGELARQKLLIPSSLIYLVVSVLQQTLFLEQHRLTYTIGSNVRDSSCFVAWSLCKRYRTSELEIDILETLFKCLILTSCFDRDLMIRRASSAALQELVGRHGDPILAKLLPNSNILNVYKVKILEILNFTVLGQQEKSFHLSLEISKSIDGLMTDDFINVLIFRGICNADYDQRKYSAEILVKFLFFKKDNNFHSNEFSEFISKLVIRYKDKPENGILYTIAELMNYIEKLDYFDDIDNTFHEIFANVKFDFHRDQFYKGEELVYLLSSLSKFGFQLNHHELDLMFNIARVGTQTPLQEKFIELSKSLINLPEKYEDQWVHYVKNGNLIMATAIGYSPIFYKKQNDILKLIENPRLDAGLRSSLVNSFSNFLQNCSNIDDEILLQLMENLDDYTITNQGDVGSFIRLATIELIKNNKERFTKNSVFNTVEKKLIRLSCEVMDRVKYRAWKLLLILKGLESYYLSYAKTKNIVIDFELNDLTFVHQKDYFRLVFQVYQHEYLEKENKEVSIELWKGMSFSGGSNQASDATINVSVQSFLTFWRTISLDEQNFILLDLLDILKPFEKDSKNSDRQFKLQNSCLRFWCNLLELNIQLPENFKLRNLFIRVYNSSLGNSNIPRLLSCIRIFTMILLSDPNCSIDCEKRLKWLMAKHPIPKISSAAAEALEEVKYEKDQLKSL